MSNATQNGRKSKKKNLGNILSIILAKLWLFTARISAHSKVVKCVKWRSSTPNSIQIFHYKRTDYEQKPIYTLRCFYHYTFYTLTMTVSGQIFTEVKLPRQNFCKATIRQNLVTSH
jgi:hypothetical protein